MNVYQTHFERLEFKFLIDEQKARRVRDAVAVFCERDRHCAPNGGYEIESLYLDTPALAFHEAKERGDAERLKLRVRRYSPTSPAALEIKRRHREVIRKHRAVIDQRYVESAIAGFDIPVPTAGSRAELTDFARLAATSGAAPVLTVRYERDAYESNVDAYARVTFDRHIELRATRHWRSIDRRGWHSLDDYWTGRGRTPLVVLELKCETHSMPQWMSELARRFQLVRTSFSKYSVGIVLTQLRAGRVLGRSRSFNAVAAA